MTDAPEDQPERIDIPLVFRPMDGCNCWSCIVQRDHQEPIRLARSGNGSDMKFIGMDLATKPDVAVECVWHDGEISDVRVVSPKPRREPFPNPEPMQYRPKL